MSEDYKCVDFNQSSGNYSLAVLRENGDNVSSLYFGNSLYIDDLSDISEVCPILKTLLIDKCPSLYDLSFIYECNNLNDSRCRRR